MDSVVHFNPDSTLGAFQIGVLVSYALFGVTTTQMYIYYSRFPDDSRKLKALVAFVWVCEVGHTFCVGHLLYTITILDYGHPERVFGTISQSLSVASLLAGIIAVCVHAFLSFRIYVLTKRPITIWVTSLRATSLGNFVGQWGWLLTSNWSISVATDFAITATLVVVLQDHRSHAQKTAAIIDKIIGWTIAEGRLSSSVASIAMLASFISMKGNCNGAPGFKINIAAANRVIISSCLAGVLHYRHTMCATFAAKHLR
ncbi:hypothetical protein MVEN_01824400 [Mycena venus]|uniref:Uncharacterized protein n=1 Tax=Mycena venus TaxID=2733690 RepID=A0A8H7CP40_9AGAR|nr:hypothetical protein MVEN_01824400 [Mycena venus]